MTSDERKGRFGPRRDDGPGGVGRDFAMLDPGREDPGYWLRFRALVMAWADGELSRRRRMAEAGVTDFVQSGNWSGSPTG